MKTEQEAIEFLQKEAGISVEIVDYKYRVFDEDFDCPIKDTKALIEYAKEQKEAMG